MEDYGMQVAKHLYQYVVRRIDIGMYNELFIKEATDTVVYFFTSYTSYLDYCKLMHPTPPKGATPLFYENCAIAYFNQAKDFTHVPQYPIYKDFSKIEESK